MKSKKKNNQNQRTERNLKEYKEAIGCFQLRELSRS